MLFWPALDFRVSVGLSPMCFSDQYSYGRGAPRASQVCGTRMNTLHEEDRGLPPWAGKLGNLPTYVPEVAFFSAGQHRNESLF